MDISGKGAMGRGQQVEVPIEVIWRLVELAQQVAGLTNAPRSLQLQAEDLAITARALLPDGESSGGDLAIDLDAARSTLLRLDHQPDQIVR